MPRASNGTYQQPGGTAAVSGQPISSSAFNTLESDIGQEITNSVDRLGRSAMEANLSLGGNIINNVANGVATTDAVNLGQQNTAIAAAAATAAAATATAQASANTAQATAQQALQSTLNTVAKAGGMLTAATGTPIMTGNVSASGTVYFTPYEPSAFPLWNGTIFQSVPFIELSNILANSSTGNAGPAAGAANSVYDLFVWAAPLVYTATLTQGSTALTSLSSTSQLVAGMPVSGSGIPGGAVITSIVGSTVNISQAAIASLIGNVTFSLNTLTRGPAWTNSTTRAMALTRVQGLFVNGSNITNGPLAGFGTHVGTIMTDASGATVTWNFGGSGVGGSAAWFGIWNRFNRRTRGTTVQDSNASWTYPGAGAWRQADGSAGNQVSFIAGDVEDVFTAANTVYCAVSANSGAIGVGVNSTTAPSGTIGLTNTSITVTTQGSVTQLPRLGVNTVAAIEFASSGTLTSHGGGDQGLTFSWAA